MLEPVREAEVGDDDIAIPIKEQVLEFEIAMDNLLLMDIPNSGDELSKEFSCVSFSQIPVSEDVIEEFTTGRIVENNADVLVRFYCFVEPDDTGVVERLEWIGQKTE